MKKTLNMKLKRVCCLSLFGSLLLIPVSIHAAQETSVTVKVNGYAIVMHEAPAYIDTDSNLTYVPLRFVSEALGAEVGWVANDQPITATIDEPEHNEVKVLLNSKKVEKNGKVSTIEGAPVLQNGRTMVPLRVISEGLGAEVKWVPGSNGENNVVEINTPWETPIPPGTVEGDTTVWKPTEEQKVYGNQIFKPLTWDNETRTLSFSIPKMPGKNPLVGIQYGNKKEKIVLGKVYTFKNLPDEFKLDITIFADETYTETVDEYTIFSYSLAKKHGWADGVPSTDIVVKDQYKNNVSLNAVYKALGISK
ncbi:stalk domain-containing protein [Paenibacillus naphthalenovorans]|uniref:Copper amine oxidase n=1 Tax=Paenibacillus naphthalenovorans TaxID=162209 RepID=A0A0U2VXD4_9BACL|nr:stalk domain-containing protein [Paenibacillus naphthalenovorans]ALS25366.1 copper amine oxidase [Paenibacillus naphthalenovorans]